MDDWGVLALEELLLGRRVRVALIVAGAGDAGGGAPVVLVNVLRIATELLVDAASIRALALALAFTLAL